MSTIIRAKEYAFKAHTGDMYGTYPYTKHLNDVYNVLVSFGVDDNLSLMAAWMHDTIEDTPIVYEDVFEDFGKRTADLIYLLSDKRGKNRHERHLNTYPLISEDPRATVVKAADRLANVMNSQHEKEKMFFMYEKEHPFFKETLLSHITEEKFIPFKGAILDIFDRLDLLLDKGPHLE
jgi:(p)ppGpp synthase/HD superfamily hydrolase